MLLASGPGPVVQLDCWVRRGRVAFFDDSTWQASEQFTLNLEVVTGNSIRARRRSSTTIRRPSRCSRPATTTTSTACCATRTEGASNRACRPSRTVAGNIGGMDLDSRYLEAFLVVGRERSFSRAAALLHKTQPAVSYQIRRLEEQLGTTLLDRSRRRPSLTRSGAQLHQLCQRFFAEFERLQASLRAGTAAALEPLRIAAVSGFGRYVLFPLLARQPELRYSLRYPTADQVFAALEDGACDLGFVYLPRVSSRLETVPVWREELVLVGPTRAAAPARLDDFAALPFVTYDESEYVFGKWFEALFGRQPRALRSRYHFEELEEVVSTVAAGRGWSIVPDHAVAAAARARQLAIVRPRRRRVGNLIYAVTAAATVEHPAAAELLAALAAAKNRRAVHQNI